MESGSIGETIATNTDKVFKRGLWGTTQTDVRMEINCTSMKGWQASD